MSIATEEQCRLAAEAGAAILKLTETLLAEAHVPSANPIAHDSAVGFWAVSALFAAMEGVPIGDQGRVNRLSLVAGIGRAIGSVAGQQPTRNSAIILEALADGVESGLASAVRSFAPKGSA